MNPSVALLREVFDYDASTGELRWRVRPAPRSRARAGDLAGSFDADGYRRVKFQGAQRQAHRVIWAFVTGAWPDEVDHDDGDRANNRWTNLRAATSSQNQQNIQKARAGSASGTVGVSWNARAGRWQAAIGVDRKGYYLGLFESVEGARSAYLAAKAVLHPFRTTREVSA